jgi:hypothetical protein
MTIEELIEEYDLKSNCRKRELVYARNVLYKYLRNQGMSLIRIGKMFNRDHATVLFALNQYDKLSKYEDFKIIKLDVTEKLGLTKKLNKKVEVSYLEQKVLDCKTYLDLRNIQEELQKVILEREEVEIFTTFDV